MRPSPLLLAFAAFGVVWGAWQAVLPELAATYELTPGPLGALLTAGFAAALPVMLVTGRLLDRFGAGWAIGVSGLAMAVGLGLVGLVPAWPLLVVAVIAFAAGSGSYDVAINGAAMGHPTWSRPARLTLLHAAFSGGGVVGALAAGTMLGAGIRFAAVYLALSIILVAVAASTTFSPWQVTVRSGSVPRAVALAMLPLAVLAGIGFLAEGSMESWSAIYLRDSLGAVAFVAALGPAAFHAAMFAGRLVGAGVAGTLGAPTTLLVAGGLTVAGMAMALLIREPAIAIAGMGIAALGAAFVVPVVVSLAADRAGAHAGRAASYVLTLGYAGFLVGPSLIGVLAEIAGLRVALGVVPLAALLIVAASRTRVIRG